MNALSQVTTREALPPIKDSEIEVLPTDKKVSRFMLELLELLMPTLQKLNKAAQELGAYSFECFKNNSSSENAQQKNIAMVSLLGLSSAAPLSDGIKTAVSSLSSAGQSYTQSILNTAATNKGIDQELVSRANQDKSTLLSTMEKLLNLIQQVQQTEKSSA